MKRPDSSRQNSGMDRGFFCKSRNYYLSKNVSTVIFVEDHPEKNSIGQQFTVCYIM